MDITVWMEPNYYEILGAGDSRYQCSTSVEYKNPEDNIDTKDITSTTTTFDILHLENINNGSLSREYIHQWEDNFSSSGWYWDWPLIFRAQDKFGDWHIIRTSSVYWERGSSGGRVETPDKLYWEKLGINLPSPSFTTGEKDFTISQVIISGTLRVTYLGAYEGTYKKYVENIGKETEYVYVPLAPTSHDPTSQEYLTLMLPNGKNELDCMSCFDFENQWENADTILKQCDRAAELFNYYRSTHPTLCVDPCNYVDHNKLIDKIGMQYVDDLYNSWYDPGDPDHTYHDVPLKETYKNESDNSTVSYYKILQGYYSELLVYQQALFYDEKIVIDPRTDPPTDQPDPKDFERFTTDALASIFSGGASADAAYRNENKVVGISIVQKIRPEFKWDVLPGDLEASLIVILHYRTMMMLTLMWGEEAVSDDEVPDEPIYACSLDCLQQIQWKQDSDPGDHNRGLPRILFPIRIPKICALQAIYFVTETRGVQAIYQPGYASLQPIPEDNSLKYNDLSEWTVTLHTNIVSTYLIPGEWVAFYVHVRVKGDCVWVIPDTGSALPIADPDNCCIFLYAYGWFETRCLTSGIVTGCGRVKFENNSYNILEGGVGQDWKASYEKNADVRWLVEVRGSGYWFKPGGFERYQLGQRAFVYKNGSSNFIEDPNDKSKIIKIVGCKNRGIDTTFYDSSLSRLTPDNNARWNWWSDSHNSPISSSESSYRISPESDRLVPERLLSHVGIDPI
jgi:hypothetical protein